MKVSIEKELEKVSNEDKQKFNLDPINEVKLLLAGESSEDARILRGLSQNSQFNRIENMRGKQIELENLEKDFDGKVYTKEQIQNLCIDYRLRFLQSRLYTGAYDVQVAAKIKEFAKSTLAPIDEYTLGRRYFVMAPKEMFELTTEKYVSKAELRRRLDPAIFYQIDENHYRLVHKWGNDFTIFRLIEGFRWKSWWSHQMFNTFMIAPIITFIYFWFFETPAAAYENAPIFNTIVIGLISFVVSHLCFGIWKQDEMEAIGGYFSKTNWDSDKKINR
jgi:hypothetical protein